MRSEWTENEMPESLLNLLSFSTHAPDRSESGPCLVDRFLNLLVMHPPPTAK